MSFNITYIGRDKTYVDELEKLAKSEAMDFVKLSFITFGAETSSDAISQLIQKGKVDAILFDYSTIQFDICSLILFLRSHELFRKIPFIGLFDKDTDHLLLRKSIQAGVTFNYLKDEDCDDFILNLNYILTDQALCLKRYATAKNQNLPMKINHQARLESVGHDELVLHSDLAITAENGTEVLTHLYEEFNVTKFPTSSAQKNQADHYLESYHLKIPYRGPWDDEKTAGIDTDTMDTWLDLKQEQFVPKQLRVLVFDGRSEVFSNKNFYESRHDVRFRFVKSIMQQWPLIIEMLPEIIIIEVDNENNTINDINELMGQVGAQANLNEHFRPAILIFNCHSSSDAFRKAYNYSGIVTSGSTFDYSIMPNLIDLYMTRTKLAEQTSYLQLFDELSFAEVSAPVTVTSISENQITFISKNEIPFFTNLYLELPQKIFVTILPPTHELAYHHNYYHYMGFIHGLNYEEKCELRAFVNWLIFYPLEASREEDRKAFFKMNKEAATKNRAEKVQAEVVEVEEEVVDEAKERKILADLKPAYKKGLSKF